MHNKKIDKTRNERQARRRAREKQWLSDHGFSSWEVVHTKLIAGVLSLMSLDKNDKKSNNLS